MSVLDNPFKLPQFKMFALITRMGAFTPRLNRWVREQKHRRTQDLECPILSTKMTTYNMKKNARNTPGPGAWFLGGVTSLLMCMSALGQYTATQNSPITINEPINVGAPATASPYPSSIYLTNANILGVLERVEV